MKAYDAQKHHVLPGRADFEVWKKSHLAKHLALRVETANGVKEPLVDLSASELDEDWPEPLSE